LSLNIDPILKELTGFDYLLETLGPPPSFSGIEVVVSSQHISMGKGSIHGRNKHLAVI